MSIEKMVDKIMDTVRFETSNYRSDIVALFEILEIEPSFFNFEEVINEAAEQGLCEPIWLSKYVYDSEGDFICRYCTAYPGDCGC